MNSLCHLTVVMTASLRRISLPAALFLFPSSFLAAASQSPSQVLCCHLQSSSALFTFRATPYTARIKTTTYMLTTSKSSTLSCAEVTPIQLPNKCHHFSLKASKCLSPKLNSVSSHSQIHSPPLQFSRIKSHIHLLPTRNLGIILASFPSFLFQVLAMLLPEISKYTSQFSQGLLCLCPTSFHDSGLNNTSSILRWISRESILNSKSEEIALLPNVLLQDKI